MTAGTGSNCFWPDRLGVTQWLDAGVLLLDRSLKFLGNIIVTQKLIHRDYLGLNLFKVILSKPLKIDAQLVLCQNTFSLVDKVIRA